MNMTNSANLREEVKINVVKWTNLETTINSLFKNFENWEERNAELIDRFFDQSFFKWEESLINKLSEINENLNFEDIKDEWINLATLKYDNWLRDFNSCINKTIPEIRNAFINEIFDKIQTRIWTAAPYADFPTECPFTTGQNPISYFQQVVKYLEDKENVRWWEKVINILKDITITNENLNTRLTWTWNEIPAWIPLSDTTIPETTKNSFDSLLSFEIGKEADRMINVANDISNKLSGLFSNSLPAINTIVWESSQFRFDEKKLWKEYNWKFLEIKNDNNLTESEKEKKIKDLKWEYYLKYLKSKNKKIGNTLEQLYNNNFDYSKLDSDLLKNYLKKVVDIRVKSLFDTGLNESLKISFGNINDFLKFYKDLADPSIDNIELDNTRWFNLPVKKSIIEWENPWLKDINEFWNNAKNYDIFPIRYEIKKSDIENMPINIEDRTNLLNFLSRFKNQDDEKYIIEWWEIWSLIYLFFIVNSKFPITNINLDKQKEIEEKFWSAENADQRKNENQKEEKEEEKSEEEEEKESKEDNPENFIKEIEKLGSGTKFENWSEIWLPIWKSELPWWWYQRMKIKISNINHKKWTFTWRFFWWELKFDKSEWKAQTFRMNEETLNKIKKSSKDSDKIWLLPDPDNSDFNSFRNSLNNKLWTSELSFPATWVIWNGSNFIQKITDDNGKEKDVEVKYFWASEDDKSTYKVVYNPFRRSFTVSSSFNWEEKWKDWKSEKKRFSYKRDMDWNNFLIFFTQKWLVPQTEEESNKAILRQDKDFKMENRDKWKLNWFSMGNLKTVFKNITWSIKKKIDEYDKSQSTKLEDILIWDRWIYSKLAWVLWFVPSIKWWLWELQQEYYNDRDNRVWKKIEWYLKIFQADPDFWTTFDQLPPHAKIQWWKSLKMIVLNRVKNAKDRMWDPGLYQAAALLLANFDKWWSPYRWLSAQENTWLWVKALLWKAHYEQFLRDKAACIRDRDLAEKTKNSWLDKKWLNEALANCEMDYIINNIRWSYWKVPYFGSHEERWINWDDATNYIDNPAKRLLSDQFANKLESASKWWFNKWTVEESYGKLKSKNNFDIVEDEFNKCGSSRYQKGAWALRRMFDLASDESLKKRAKRHFLTYLLCWALDINCDPGLKKQVYGWAKPMSFVPWMLVKEAWVAENIAILLDDATGWDFSKNVTKYFRRAWQLKSWPDFKWVQWELKKWLTDEKMEKLDDYFAKLPTKDFSKHSEPQNLY